MSDKSTQKLSVPFFPVLIILVEKYDIETAVIYGYMWSRSNQFGKCEISHGTIAKKTGYHINTVSRRIQKLEEYKLIVDLTPNLKHHVHTYSIESVQ